LFQLWQIVRICNSHEFDFDKIDVSSKKNIPNTSPSHMLKEKQFIASNKDLKQAIF